MTAAQWQAEARESEQRANENEFYANLVRSPDERAELLRKAARHRSDAEYCRARAAGERMFGGAR